MGVALEWGGAKKKAALKKGCGQMGHSRVFTVSGSQEGDKRMETGPFYNGVTKLNRETEQNTEKRPLGAGQGFKGASRSPRGEGPPGPGGVRMRSLRREKVKTVWSAKKGCRGRRSRRIVAGAKKKN